MALDVFLVKKHRTSHTSESWPVWTLALSRDTAQLKLESWVEIKLIQFYHSFCEVIEISYQIKMS